MFKRSLKALNEAIKKEFKVTTSNDVKELKLLDGVNGIDYRKSKK